MFRLKYAVGLVMCGLVLLVGVSGEPQHYIWHQGYKIPYMHPSPAYINHQPVDYREVSSYELRPQQTYLDPRIFFSLLAGNNGLVTITYATSTTTSTSTVTTYCTTSTATLATCTVGRRRRGLFYNDVHINRVRRGLPYAEDDTFESNADLVNSVIEQPDADRAVTNDDKKREVELNDDVATHLQSSMSKRIGRQIFSFAVATSTTTTTITTTSVLIAICSSTTGFATCGSG